MTLIYNFDVYHTAQGEIELDMTLDEWESLSQEERDEIINEHYEEGYNQAWKDAGIYDINGLIETFAEE